MRNIIRSEFFRARKSGITMGISIYYAVTTFFWIIIYTVAKFDKDIGEVLAEQGFPTFTTFPMGTLYFLLLAFFVGGLLAGDYSTGAIKQIASRGVERKRIILGQYFVVSIWITGITFAAALLRALVATAFWGIGEGLTPLNLLLMNLGWFAVIWSYSAFAVLVAHFVRSSMLSLVIHICFFIGGNIVVMIVSILVNNDRIADFIYDFWPTHLLDHALDFEQTPAAQLGYIALLLVLGGACLGLCMWLFEKRDVA